MQSELKWRRKHILARTFTAVHDWRAIIWLESRIWLPLVDLAPVLPCLLEFGIAWFGRIWRNRRLLLVILSEYSLRRNLNFPALFGGGRLRLCELVQLHIQRKRPTSYPLLSEDLLLRSRRRPLLRGYINGIIVVW